MRLSDDACSIGVDETHLWLSISMAPHGWIAVLLSSVAIFMMGGVVFGLPGLYPFIYQQRMWTSECNDINLSECQPSLKCCDAQLVQLSLLASVAFFVSDAAAAPWGEVVDRIGGRNTLALSVATTCIAFVALGLGATKSNEELTVAAVMLLALAGPGVCSSSYIACLDLVRYAVSNQYQPAITAALTSFVAAVVNGSALVLGFLQLASLHSDVVFMMATVCWAVLCGLVAIALRSVLGEDDATLPLSPRVHAMLTEQLWGNATEERGEIAQDPRERENGNLTHRIEQQDDSERFSEPCTRRVSLDPPGNGILSSSRSSELSWRKLPTDSFAPPLLPTLLQSYNLLLIFTMTVLNLIFNFYIQSQADQAALMFAAQEAEVLRQVFNISFPVIGFASVVVAWRVLSEFTERVYWYWAIVVLLGNAFNLLTMMPFFLSQLAAALLFGLVRTLQWGAYFHFLANRQYYMEETTGRAVGYNGLVVAILSDGLPYVLAEAVSNPTWGEHLAGRYIIIKFILQFFMLGSFAFPLYLFRYHRTHSIVPPRRPSWTWVAPQKPSEKR